MPKRERTTRRPHERRQGHGAAPAILIAAAVIACVVGYAVMSTSSAPESPSRANPTPAPQVHATTPAKAEPAPEPLQTQIPADPAPAEADAKPSQGPSVEPVKLWVEVEHGTGHTATQDKAQASNGKHVGWFGKGRSVVLSYDVPSPIAHARLYLRYGRGEQKTTGALSVTIEGPNGQRRPSSTIELAYTGAWDKHQWLSMPLGELSAGTWTITLRCTSDHGAGDLDVTVLIDDRWDGLWEPTNTFENGQRVGEGGIRSPFDLKFEATAFRSVYNPNSAITYSVEATNRSSTSRTARLSWRILDFNGTAKSNSATEVTLEPSQTKKMTLEVATDLNRGWYAVMFDDGNGGVQHRYFVCMEPTLKKDRTASRFGINSHGMAEEDEEYALATRLGVGWLRGLSLWHLVQPGSNREQTWQDRPYKWEGPDRQLELSEKYGLERMGSFAFSCAWASSTDPHHGNWWGQSFYPPDDLSPSGPYATYVKKLVARYKRNVKYWEHWNEPDIHFWKGTPAQYVDTLACAHKAAKSADANAIVLNGGYANIGLQNIQRMLEKRIGEHQEIIGIHGYNNTFIKVWPLKRIYERAGLGNMPVWNTETGREPSMNENRPFDEKMPWMRGQAHEVARTFLKNIVSGVDRVFWFCYAWEPYGVFTTNGPRPSAMAFRTLSDLIDTPKPAKLLGTLDLGAEAKGIFAFVFKRTDGVAIVIWREDRPTKSEHGAGMTEVSIPVGSDARCSVYGIDGRDLGIAPRAGALTVPARTEPTLVHVTGSVRAITKRIGWTSRYSGPVKASIQFTDGEPITKGMYASAFTLSKEVAGKHCAATAKNEAQSDGDKFYIGFDLADDLLWEMCNTSGVPKRPMEFRVTYFDRGTGPVGIQYAERDTKVQRTGTGTWKTATMSMPDPGFPNQGCHCDFRMTSWAWGGADDIEIHKVEIIEKD